MPSHIETFLRKIVAFFGTNAPLKRSSIWDRLHVAALFSTMAFGAFWVLYVIFSVAGNPPMGADAATKTAVYLEDFEVWSFPQELAPFTITTDEGETRSIGDFEGKVILINIWATWCPPCVEEMPALDRLQQIFKEEDFEVVAVSIDRGGVPKIREFYERRKISSLPVYSDQTLKISRELGQGTLPVSVLISAKGKELGRINGPAVWDGEPALRLIRKVLRDGSLH